MSIETEHRGYIIRYSENEDLWVCYDCRVRESSLARAKAKIDGLHRQMRKAAAVACYVIDTRTEEDLNLLDAKAIDYLGEKFEGYTQRKSVGHEVAVMTTRRGNERPGRTTMRLQDLVAEDPSLPERLNEINRLRAVRRRAQAAEKAAIDALPRVQFEDIAGLVEAAGARIEETPE